jgi:hypothetical protein
MFVCPNCFADRELKAFISASSNFGDCSVCASKKVSLLPVGELMDFFQELIDNYKIADGGEPLKSKIQGKWSFFASHATAKKILNHILKQLSTEISNADTNVDYTDDIIDNYTHWERLKEELKWSRRFISDIGFLEELGWDGFFNTQFQLTPDDLLYRARVHHQSGQPAYLQEKMMNPSANESKGGRANPLGIPYLYLSDNPETVLYEIRAAYLDELSIGVFHLKEDHASIKIVDFTEETPLFQPSKVNETIKAHLLRERISRDLSKPMRRYDSEIEYIPTQFICEFIRIFTGASGIRFGSSLHPEGKNVVIFDQNLITCKEVLRKRINSVDLRVSSPEIGLHEK